MWLQAQQSARQREVTQPRWSKRLVFDNALYEFPGEKARVTTRARVTTTIVLWPSCG